MTSPSSSRPEAAFMDHARMRETNLALILSCLRERKSLSRSKLAELTGLTKATISSLVKELIERGFLVELGATAYQVGRPSISLEINPRAGYIIGAEIGVDFLAVILTDFSARTVWKGFEQTGGNANQAVVLSRLKEMIQRAVEQANADSRPVLGIGLGAPGLVDESSGQLLFAPNLGWRDVPLRKYFEDAFQIPVYVDNEANLAALGESYFGAAQEADLVLYVSSGVGIGGGIVQKKQILRGQNGFAGEIGHMVIEPGGLECTCGGAGCWETAASQRAVFRRIAGAIAAGRSSILTDAVDQMSGLVFSTVADAAQQGDEVAIEALRETGRYLGIGIANLINILNPEIVVFGGILSLAGEFLFPAIQTEIERQALPWSRQKTRLVIAQHGVGACVMGGVAAVYHRVLSQPSLME